MRDRHALATAVVCVVATVVTVLVVCAGAVRAQAVPAIELSVTLAAAGDTVDFSGESGVADAGDCEVELDGDTVPAKCIVDKAGAVEGSFQIPATRATGSVKVAVCYPGCGVIDDAVPQWSWSDALQIGVTVPEVRGRSVAQAKKTLTGVGLVGAPDPDSADDAQTVQDQNPKPGELLRVGSTVKLRVAPPSPELVEVPGVTGLTVDEAQKILDGKEFVPVVVGDTGGTVFRQDPSPGELRPPGTSVRIWLQPPEPASTSPPGHAGSSPADSSPAGETPGAIGVVDDAVDRRVIGLIAVVVIGVIGCLLAGMAFAGRRHGKRWARRHLRISGTAGMVFGPHVTQAAAGGPRSIQVVATRHEPALAIRERSS